MYAKKYYRIIDSANSQEKTIPSPLGNRKQLQALTKSLIKQRKFMYIDINQEQGFKIMKECESSDSEEEVEKIGNKYLVNLNNLFTRNSKGLSYIYRYKKQVKKKEHVLGLVQEELRRSTQKIESLGKATINQKIDFYSNKTVFQRYTPSKPSKKTLEPNQHSSHTTSPLSKRPKLFSTISYQKSTKESVLSPKRYQAAAISLQKKHNLPDLKRRKRMLH